MRLAAVSSGRRFPSMSLTGLRHKTGTDYAYRTAVGGFLPGYAGHRPGNRKVVAESAFGGVPFQRPIHRAAGQGFGKKMTTSHVEIGRFYPKNLMCAVRTGCFNLWAIADAAPTHQRWCVDSLSTPQRGRRGLPSRQVHRRGQNTRAVWPDWHLVWRSAARWLWASTLGSGQVGSEEVA